MLDIIYSFCFFPALLSKSSEHPTKGSCITSRPGNFLGSDRFRTVSSSASEHVPSLLWGRIAVEAYRKHRHKMKCPSGDFKTWALFWNLYRVIYLYLSSFLQQTDGDILSSFLFIFKNTSCKVGQVGSWWLNPPSSRGMQMWASPSVFQYSSHRTTLTLCGSQNCISECIER